MSQLRADAQTLLKYAKHFTVDKEPCVYWDKPLAGEWTPVWGGELVTTLHNANGWAAGRLFLDFYRLEQEGESKEKSIDESQHRVLDKKSAAAGNAAGNNVSAINSIAASGLTKSEISRCLQVIDGVFNWTKHIVWTRNEFADRPSAPSAAGSTLAAAFLLDYYFTFADDQLDGERRTRALQALEMARVFTYRYMILRAGDSEASETGNHAFSWESTAGREAIGAADTMEVMWNLDTLAQVAVHTGDPVLIWALQGSLAHRHLFSPDVNRPEQSNFLSMVEPVGKTQVRVLCGAKAAMAFDRNTRGLLATNYRCTHPGDFACTLRRASAIIE